MKTKTFFSRMVWDTPQLLRKSKTSLKALTLLLVMLMSVNVWGETWSYTVAKDDAMSNNSITKNGATWTFTGDSKTGSPTNNGAKATITKNTTYALQFGNSKDNYYGKVTLSTSYFSSYNVTSVSVKVKNNGSKVGKLTVKQGNVEIGTQSNSSATNSLETLTANTKKGEGGDLYIIYEVEQASLFNEISVTYESDDPSCTSRTITFAGSPTTVEKTTADVPFKYAASIDVADGQTIGYTSSDTKVATVAADGTVTIVEAGTTTITASVSATETYCEASAFYTVNVTKPVFSCWTGSLNCDFTKISGFSEWGSTYKQHVVEYTNLTVTFASANKQGSTITDCPVTKGNPVTFVAAENKVITQIHVKCKQWSADKAQTITLNYSTDGGTNYQTLNPSVTSSDFEIESTNLPEGTNAVKLTFSSNSNQIGIASACVTIEDAPTLNSINVKTAPKLEYNANETFNPTGLVITATYDDASTKDITYDANDTKWEFLPDLTDKLDATDNEVIISYNNVMCDDALEITVNRIASNLAAVSATKILTIDDAPSLADWYTIDANYDGTVSFQSDDEEVFLVSGTDGLAYGEGSATLTITAPQTDTYAQASVTVAVTVNAAAVPCSVTWMNNGEEYTAGDPSTVVNAGQKVSKLPTAPTPCDAQHVFKGWTNAAIATPQADAPSVLFTDAASAPTVDADGTIYYAVYAVESPGSDVLTKMVVGNTLANGDKIVIVAHKDGDLTDDVAMYQETVSSSYVNKYAFDGNINSVLANNKNWLTVNTKEGGFSLGDATNGYIYSSSNNLYCGETAQVWTLNDLEDGTFKLQSDGRNLSYRCDLSSQYWRMGGASYGTSGQTVLDIYKIEAGDVVCSDYSTTCAAVELDAIELGGTYPTTFLMGDELSHEGMTVTASYKNSATTKDVTNLATFSGYDANTLGEQIITVSYTEGEDEDTITKTATYKVTVNDLPNKTIQEFIAAQGVKCYLTAIVSNLDGNQYDLTDNSGTIHGYKYTLATGISALANGDRIRVRAEEYEYYQGKTHEVKNIVVLEKLAFSAIAVSGTMSVTEYTEGNTLNSEGLVVKGKYADEDEAKHVITEGITWNMPTAVLGTSEYDVKATVGGLSDTYHVTGITVNSAKVLTGIEITTEPKKTFWVGENFSTTGIQVMASYDGDEDADVTTLCTFSRAEAQITDAIVDETITVSYTEGTETKTATYTINANWMTLADLVENVTPTGTAVKVWVKITDALVKVRNNSYLTTDVTYGDSQTKEVKIYKSGVDAAWVAGGTISGELKGVDWKLYGSDWELMPSDWNWATYTPAPATAVTGVSLPATVDVKVGKTTTLTATVTPDNATDKSVTWAIVNDNANGKVTVDQDGKVSVDADATVGATADVKVTTTDGGFTATCTVTVVAAQVKYFALATSTADLDAAVTNGKKVVIAPATSETDEVVMGTYASGNNIKAIEADYADERIALEVGEDAFYTIAKDGDYYTFQDGNDKYIYAAGGTGSNNHLKAKTELEATGKWTIAIDATTKNATIKTSDATVARHTIMFNSTLFSCYASGQTAIALYVEAEKPQYIPVESIELNETSAEVMVGKKLTLTATVGPDNATQKGVTWTSNNDKVTVVDGLVTVDAEATVGATATITATTVGTTTDGGSEHLSATCIITVTELVGTKYGLVSNINTLYDGAVVVLGAVYEKNSEMKYAVSGAIGTGKYMASVDVAAADYADEVMLSSGATEITLHKVEGGWTMTSDEGNIYLSGADVKVSTSTDATIWTISIAEGKAVIKNGDYQFFYNKNSGSERFKPYNTTTQEPVGIYMKNLVAVRTGLTAGKIGTICYPKAIAAVDGANLYQPNYKDDAVKNIYFSTPDEYKAGLPMIFQADREIMKVLFTGDEASLIEDMEITRGMVGSFEHVDIENNGKNFIFSNNKLYLAGENCWIDSNRAYIDLSQVPFSDGQLSHDLPGGAPRKTISLGNASASTPTNLNGLNGNMKAQKVMKDGQFYIIREAKMYNAQGIKVQ